jgi:hypothetical protein
VIRDKCTGKYAFIEYDKWEDREQVLFSFLLLTNTFIFTMRGSQHELKDKGNDGKKRQSEWQIRGKEQHPILLL